MRSEKPTPQIEQTSYFQTHREATAQDLKKFALLDELIRVSQNKLKLRYAWDTIQEDRKKRKAHFDTLPEEVQQAVQEALITSLETNNFHLIPALFFIGRETDLGLVEEVPKDQRINMEIAVRFCRANELASEANVLTSQYEDTQIPEAQYNRLLAICQELIEELKQLQQFEIIATHSTDAKSRENIEKSGGLWAAARNNLYLGEGVYAGVFGSYQDWNSLDESGKNKAIEDNTYRFTIPLSECSLVINNPLSPRAMINIQYGSLDAKSISVMSQQSDGKIPQAKVSGNPYYERNTDRQLNKQGAQLFRKLVKDLNLAFGFIGDAQSKSLIRQHRDAPEENLKHIIIDTDESPLVWVTLADICGLERMTLVDNLDEEFVDIA